MAIDLSERSQHLLRSLIESYIRKGQVAYERVIPNVDIAAKMLGHALNRR